MPVIPRFQSIVISFYPACSSWATSPKPKASSSTYTLTTPNLVHIFHLRSNSPLDTCTLMSHRYLKLNMLKKNSLNKNHSLNKNKIFRENPKTVQINLVKLQYKKLIYKNLLHFYVLIKRRNYKNSIYNCIKKNTYE